MDIAKDIVTELGQVLLKVTGVNFERKLLIGKDNNFLAIGLFPLKSRYETSDYCIDLERFLGSEYFKELKYFRIMLIEEGRHFWITMEEANKIKKALEEM